MMSTQTQTKDVIAQVAEEKRTWPGWSTIESEPVGIFIPLADREPHKQAYRLIYGKTCRRCSMNY